MADDDFSTGAELELTVSDSSLSAARDTIESELGDLEVDVNAVVSGNRSGTQPRDPSSGQFMAIEGVEQRQVNTNETLDGLAQIETERWELDKYRNNYLEQLAETSMLPGGGQQGGGGGGGGLAGTAGLTKLLGGISLSGGATALAGGSTLAGAFGLNELVGSRGTGEVAARGAAQSMGNPASFATAIGSELGKSITVGLSDDAQSAISQFGNNIELPALSDESWPALPALSEESWPDVPDLTQEFEWPDPPEFDLNPFDGDGQQEAMTRSRSGLTQRGPNESIQPVEPTINLGGFDLDIDVSELDNMADDIVNDVESFIDKKFRNLDLERRIADAIDDGF